MPFRFSPLEIEIPLRFSRFGAEQFFPFVKKEKHMDVDLIFKIAAIGILVAVLNQLLIRSGREEQALMTTLAGLVVVLVILVERISQLFDLIKALFQF